MIIPIFGGLGNQMFQVAHAIKLQSVTGQSLDFVDLTQHMGGTGRLWELECFTIPCRQVSSLQAAALKVRVASNFHLRKIMPDFPTRVLDERLMNYGDNAKINQNTCFGYWQGEQYFADVVETVKKRFTFPKLPNPYANLPSSPIRSRVALHVRRGDYVSDPHTAAFHSPCNLDWYQRAMAVMKAKVPNALFLVFTDDPDWAREAFRANDDVRVISTPDSRPAWVDMSRMSQCDHFIISNSTYSWWAAFLGEKSSSKFISPQYWLRGVKTMDLPIFRRQWTLL